MICIYYIIKIKLKQVHRTTFRGFFVNLFVIRTVLRIFFQFISRRSRSRTKNRRITDRAGANSFIVPSVIRSVRRSPRVFCRKAKTGASDKRHTASASTCRHGTYTYAHCKRRGESSPAGIGENKSARSSRRRASFLSTPPAYPVTAPPAPTIR